MSKILQHTWIKKTKKTHRCMWCAQVIEAGSAATYNAVILDGELSRGRADNEKLPPAFSAGYRGRR